MNKNENMPGYVPLVFLLVGWLIFYLCGSFITLEPDPLKWDTFGRFLLVLADLMWLIAVANAWADSKNN